MLTDPAGQSGAFNAQHMEDTAMNVVENACAIFCRPVELILRPFHGSQYFSVVVITGSTVMMILLPAFGAFTTGIASMIPLVHMAPPSGLFGMGSLARLYFLLSFVHSIRIYRRMIHMELEENSGYEGPALPIFALVPWGKSFWGIRILWEPALLLITAKILEYLFILQSGLTLYLELAAFALAMKNFIGWFKAWKFIRGLMDAKFAAPIIAKLIDNQATEEDLATIHLASFPKNLPPDIRAATISHIARAYSPDAAEGAAH